MIELLLVILLGVFAFMSGELSENDRLKQKCLVEMQDKPHKEATTICNERVK